MKVENVFENLQETSFLEELASEEKIIFIGDKEIIDYLKIFFALNSSSDSNYYCYKDSQEQRILLTSSKLQHYRAVLITSLNNEHAIFKNVIQQINTSNLGIPILKLFDDVFVNLMTGQSLLQPTICKPKLPQISYAIFTTPRSGSTFLCSILQSIKIAGYPTEHLRQASAFLARNCHFDYLKLLHALIEYKTTPNGVFGTKFISHFLEVFEKSKLDFEQIFHAISHYIYLVRKDKVAQAVSIVLAQKTNIWHIIDVDNQENYQAKLERINIEKSLLEEVHNQYLFIQQQEAYLTNLFTKYTLNPLIIEYEELVEDTPTEIRKILAYLNIDNSELENVSLNSHLRQMRSDLSKQIINRYLDKYGVNKTLG